MATVQFPCEIVIRSLPETGSKPLKHHEDTIGKAKDIARGLTVSFVTGPPSENTLSLKPLHYSRNSVANICYEWFKTKIEFVEELSATSGQIRVLDEAYLRSFKSFSEMQREIEGSDRKSDTRSINFPPTIFIGAANFVAKLHRDPGFESSEKLFFVTNP